MLPKLSSRARCGWALASAVACAAGPVLAQNARGKLDPPPGLVRVEGGAAVIGSTVEFAKAEGLQNERNFANVVCETPQHTRKLDDFFLMVTEVTNEQYEAFVRATGHRAPSSWGTRAIDAARAAFEAEQARARAAGTAQASDAEEFDRAAWWARNWQTAGWEVPRDATTRPVTFVDYGDSLAYARWAGLRPMSEFEFQRAGRGKGTAAYSWGNDADPTRAATVELVVDGKKVQPAEPFPVGTFARGATARGIHDLCGNVWEWTSSPFTPYPGHVLIQIEVGAGKNRRKLDGLTAWSAERRVVAGGCFYNDLFTARLATRRPADPAQRTDSLGFRCAASSVPGLDAANFVLDAWPETARPKGARFDATKVLAAERWQSVAGTAGTKAGGSPLAGYAVITGYDYVLFAPAIDIDVVSVPALVELSQRKNLLVPLGVLATTKPVLEPPLAAGSYVVAFAARGMADSGPRTDTFDPDVDHFVFLDLAGTHLATTAVPKIEFMHPPDPTLTLSQDEQSVASVVDGKVSISAEPVTLATLHVSAWVRLSNRGLAFDLPLVFAQGDVGDDWRHP